MFRITCLSNGWFGFSLQEKENTFEITCTNIGAYDVVRELLSAINNMLYEKQNQAHFLLNHESYACLMVLVRKGDCVHIEIKEVIDPTLNLIRVDGPASLHSKCGSLVFACNVGLFQLSHDIWSELKEIDPTDYCTNWNEYPSEEIQKLDQYIVHRI
jgi:hypothetical protein